MTLRIPRTLPLRIWLLCLCLCFCCALVVGTRGGVVNARASFTGGLPCDGGVGGRGRSRVDQCEAGERMVDTYACSDGRGNWNAGSADFKDPIPAKQGFVLQRLNGTLYGTFYCNANASTVPGILVILQDGLVAALNNLPTSNCSCPQCVTSQSFESYWTKENGFPDYEYGYANTLTFEMSSTTPPTICLSFVDITLTYGIVEYSVSYVSPAIGPNSGGTHVYVHGEKFQMVDQWWCRFGGMPVAATFINETTLNCTSPAISSKAAYTNVTLEVSQDGVAYTVDGVIFTYKDEPNEMGVIWIWAAIGTCVASVLFVAIAGYFYAQKHKRNHDQSLIDENSRLINSDKYKQYGAIQPVDMSEIIIQQRIGRGSCAEVFMGLWRGTTVAIKKAKVFADDDEEFFMELSQEAAIMSELRHPNVLQFLGTASNPPEIVIIMEYMARGSLYRIIHDKTIDLSWPRVKTMALDIARGMNYLHCSDPIIIHRDLKSHNLLVDEHFKVKVCDFGLSTMVKRHLDKFTAMTPVGTPCWTAPEVLRNEPYTERADVFSYGVVLWELVTREDPYQGMPTFQIVLAVGQHKMRPLIPSVTTPALAQLMVDCWNEDPNLRPPFSEVVSRLEKM